MDSADERFADLERMQVTLSCTLHRIKRLEQIALAHHTHEDVESTLSRLEAKGAGKSTESG